MKKPFIHALAAALYIVMIVLVMRDVISFLRDKQDTINDDARAVCIVSRSHGIRIFVRAGEAVHRKPQTGSCRFLCQDRRIF